jgi:hypothetical protein
MRLPRNFQDHSISGIADEKEVNLEIDLFRGQTLKNQFDRRLTNARHIEADLPK